MPLNFDNLMFVISAVEFLYTDEPYNLLYFIFIVVGAIGDTERLDDDRQSTSMSENEKNIIFQQQMNRQADRY